MIDRVSVTQPFPLLLRWALLGPLALFALFVVFGFFLGPLSNVGKGIILAAFATAVLTELIAVPFAIFLIVRDWYYRSTVNVFITLAAAAPLALALLVIWIFKSGPIH
jgi:ABC-type arginine/histidine transport system permease subunit